MNSIDSQNVNDASKLPSNEPKNEDLPFPNRSQFLSSFNQNQLFSFPDSIMYYISKNPSTAKLYQKMIQSCKYFFVKNPILIIPDFNCFDNNEWYNWDNQNRTATDIKITSSKFWITDELMYTVTDDRSLATSLIPKIFKCDASEISISYQTLFYDEFVFLASNATCLTFYYVTIIERDGTVIPFEKIVASVPKIDHITL